MNNVWFDPRKHRTPTTSVVMRGLLSSGSALNYHTLVLELGGGYNVLLGLMENFPVDAVAQLNQLLASKRPVLVKGELLRSKESSPPWTPMHPSRFARPANGRQSSHY
ncbi:hypothetical protein [Paludibacterium denitrificans]|uniref:Uncharacterized protein n=1 Tax=Paludibacterium denitrificans TaxID=2675226 RepID=A0A844GAV0_9NEIS|nr:hypothetical protein [Paludibacterium denitrificans]MTD33543.1 hypothetical protein [Paludibacterium denitrificans]